MVNWQNAQIEKKPYVIDSNGNELELHDGTYTDTTPLSAENLNKMQSDLQDLATRKYYFKTFMLTSGKSAASNQKVDLYSNENFTTTGKPLLITASCTVSVTANMWVIECVIDNNKIYEVASGNNSSAQYITGQALVSNLAKGSHTIQFKLKSSGGGTASVYSYNKFTFSAVEI